MSNMTNGYNTDEIRGYLNRIDEVDDQLATLKSNFMSDCKGPRQRIKYILKEVKGADININAFREVLFAHRQERRRVKRVDEMEADDRDVYEMIMDALGEFADTPLGQAALARARPDEGEAALDNLR